MPKDEFRGYAGRFEKAGETLRDVTSEHDCTTQYLRSPAGNVVTEEGCDDGTKMLIRRVWRKGDRPGVTLYAIVGECPKGHKVERYGYGGEPKVDRRRKVFAPELNVAGV